MQKDPRLIHDNTKQQYRILAIDDSPYTLNLIEDMLSPLEITIEKASSGMQGIELYDKFKPNMVLLDVSMPIMDGFEVLAKLVKLDPHVSVILTTALENENMIQRGLDKGAIGYLSKPFTKNELIAVLKTTPEQTNSKFFATVFHTALNKVYRSIKKINSDYEISLKSIKAYEKQISLQNRYTISDISQIRSVPESNNLKIKQDDVNFGSNFFGAKSGLLMSSLSEKGYEALFDDVSDRNHTALEFFNILNMKIISQFGNIMDSDISLEPIRFINENVQTEFQTLVLSEVEISNNEQTVPILLQLGIQ